MNMGKDEFYLRNYIYLYTCIQMCKILPGSVFMKMDYEVRRM